MTGAEPDPDRDEQVRALQAGLVRLRADTPANLETLKALRKRHERRTREVLEPDAG